jgi:3-oxoadipate enol-lactonase
MAIVTVDGRQIGYEESGSGEPLILIHGGVSDRHQYDIFRPLLGDGIRAIAYDQRDTRENPYEAGSYNIRDLAKDLANFITAMGLERAHILGHSLGGTIAMTIAIDYPDRVQSVILAGTTPASMLTREAVQGVLANNARMDEASALAGDDRADTPMDGFLLPMGITKDKHADPQVLAEVRAVIRPGTPASLERRLMATTDHDVRDELHRIAAPTLVLHGENDLLASADGARFMAERIKGSRLVLLPDTGHSLTIQHRREVAPIVREFVLRHPI